MPGFFLSSELRPWAAGQFDGAIAFRSRAFVKKAEPAKVGD
jgi:hypothetical protein